MVTRVVVIGAGIIGLATARALRQRLPQSTITVLDKANRIAAHQSGHNSGVLHSGVYYAPGSLQAKTCLAGRSRMEAFCQDRGIAWKRTGKVIVATNSVQVDRLEVLQARGRENNVNCHLIDAGELGQVEPGVRGLAALHVADTGVVDFSQVCRALAAEIEGYGTIQLGREVKRLYTDANQAMVHLDGETIVADLVVCCCGLQADRIARATGLDPGIRILPFRGEYWQLVPPADELVRGLIYPVADPSMPFLGVHFTRGITGCVEAGPSAVPALAREGYQWRDINLADLAESLCSARTWRLAQRWWRHGLGEIQRSLSKQHALASMQTLLPDLRAQDLVRSSAGVRAQAVSSDGQLVDDFAVARHGRIIHVLNAPSPAATASLAIGDHLADLALQDTATRLPIA